MILGSEQWRKEVNKEAIGKRRVRTKEATSDKHNNSHYSLEKGDREGE